MIDYQNRYLEEKRKQLILWKGMINNIFDEEPNESIKITDSNRIIEILNMIGKDQALNHTFIPSGGGLDLSGAIFFQRKRKARITFWRNCFNCKSRVINLPSGGGQP